MRTKLRLELGATGSEVVHELLDRTPRPLTRRRRRRVRAALPPTQAFTNRTPGADPSGDTQLRVLHDIADKAGTLTLRVQHHVPIGTENARTPALKLLDELHIRTVNAATGELLRELILDPRRDCQPLGRPPGPPPTNRKPDPS